MNQRPVGLGIWSLALSAVFMLPAFAQAGEDVEKVLERADVQEQYTWATERIFPSDEAWEAEYKEVSAAVDEISKFKGTLGEGAEQLLSALRFMDELEPRIDRIYVYTSLLSDQDTRVGKYQGMKQQAFSLYSNYAQKTSWREPELAAIPKDKVETWMQENEGLALYRQFFDDLWRQKQYILPAEQEELMSLTLDVRRAPSNAYNLLTNADLEFPTIEVEEGKKIELSDSIFYDLMRNPDRKVREAAYRGIVGTYKNFRNTAAALLNGAVQSHILTVKARGYDSCLQAALNGGNIPPEVYHTLVSTVNENLGLLHRYQAIRQRTLGLEDGVRAWDLFAPLISGESYKVEYDEAIKTITTALEPLGPDYLQPMTKGFASRWVDVFPTKGKRSGAYSSGTYLTQPYILMNFHGGYEDMSTLAHEMGHSMHSYFSRGSQPYVYSQYDIFCAEVASTCNEILLQNYVLENTKDPKQKLYLICEFLEQIRGTVFRQTMFSEFEERIHVMGEKGEPLTADTLGAAYGEIMKKYYGPNYAHDELVDAYWIRIPHFYYNFYVYKYATSYCAASNIARRIMDGEAGAVEAYMSFLKGGSSKYPIDLLKMARVDMTTAEPIDDAMKIFENLLDQAESLLTQVGK